MRDPTQKVISISIDRQLLTKIDEACADREMDRSSYLRWCARKELGLTGAPSPVAKTHEISLPQHSIQTIGGAQVSVPVSAPSKVVVGSISIKGKARVGKVKVKG